MLLNTAKLIGAGLIIISILATGVGIRIIFAPLINAYLCTLEHAKQLFIYAILRFALLEAITLFGLMMNLYNLRVLLQSNMLEKITCY